ALAGRGIGQHITFDEQPLRVGDSFRIHMTGTEVTGNGQAGPHGPLSVRRDDAQTGASRYIDNDRIADVDVQLFKFRRVEETIAIIADATNECTTSAELRKGDDGIGHRSAADQPRIVIVELFEQTLLLDVID